MQKYYFTCFGSFWLYKSDSGNSLVVQWLDSVLSLPRGQAGDLRTHKPCSKAKKKKKRIIAMMASLINLESVCVYSIGMPSVLKHTVH